MDIKNQLDRRGFMKKSGLALGATALSTSMLDARNKFAAGEIKIGLIGCGGRGTGAVVQALSTTQNVKLVAMCDAFRDNLDKCYTKITDPEFSDWSSDEPKNLNPKIDVPETRKFSGFNAYKRRFCFTSRGCSGG